MDVDWQAHQRWVEVGGTPVNVIDLGGDGDPVVFVHGLSGCWQNWLENLPFFRARGHRTLALDLPGFGASPMPREPITIAGYGRTVVGLLDALDLPSATVVGNSMGGFTAAECAISHPERTDRIVLDAAAGISIEQQRDERILRVLESGERVLAAYGGWIASKSELVARRKKLRKQLFALVAAHPGRLPAPLVAEQLRGSGKPGFVQALDALTSYPIRDRLPEIQAATLIVHGTRDKLVPVRDADEFERLIPGAIKRIYEDTGHVPQMERPARFNEDVARFIDGSPLPTRDEAAAV